MKLTLSVIISELQSNNVIAFETFTWSIMWKILSFFYGEKCFFLIIPTCFPALKMRKIVEKTPAKIISFPYYKEWYLIHTEVDKATKVLVWFGHCHLRIEGHMKLRLQFCLFFLRQNLYLKPVILTLRRSPFLSVLTVNIIFNYWQFICSLRA